MRQFAASGFRLWNLSREAKVIYTFFCVLSLAAIGSSLLLYEDLVGPTLGGSHLDEVRAYYSTGAARAPEHSAEAPSPAGGPAIALPAEADTPPTPAAEPSPPGRLIVTIPYRKLLEVTHFHLFTVPVFLLILTHLFMLTAMSPRWKLLHITAGWSSGTLHIFAPWLVRLGGPGLSVLFPLSGVLFLISSLILCVYPMVVMWRQPLRRSKEVGAAPATAEADA